MPIEPARRENVFVKESSLQKISVAFGHSFETIWQNLTDVAIVCLAVTGQVIEKSKLLGFSFSYNTD